MYEKGKPPIAITYAGAIMWGGSNMNLSVYKLHKLNNSPKIFCNEGKKLDFGEVNVCCVMCVSVSVEKTRDIRKERDGQSDVFCTELISRMLVLWFVQCTHT